MNRKLNKKALGMAQRRPGVTEIEISSGDYVSREIRNFNFKVVPSSNATNESEK